MTLGKPEEHTPFSVVRPSPRTAELATKLDMPPPFAREKISFKQTKAGVVFTLPFEAGERIYGFGLQLKSFLQTGKKKIVRSNADPVSDSGDSHAPVPFYVSQKGYAVFVDTYRNASFYCGCSANKEKDQIISVNEIRGNPEGLYERDKKSADMVVSIPAAEGADIYFVSGADMLDCVERYNLWSGGGFVPPITGLSAIYRCYAKADSSAVLAAAERLREDGMPVSVIGLEPGWHSHSYSCSFEWDKERFPDYREMLEKLRDMDFEVNLWEQAFVHKSAPMYEKLKSHSGDYMVWDGLVPDFADETAVSIFSVRQKELLDEGVAGFKMDECDGSELYPYHWSFPNCAEFPSGMDGEQYHNALGILMQGTENRVFHARGRRSYGQVRASHAFAAPQPFVLYSDLYEHRDFMRALAVGGFSGLLWTPEVRQTGSYRELIRRLQTNILSPQVCINSWMLPNFPWYQFDHDKNHAGEFEENREEMTAVCRRLLEFRASLIPYLYAAFYRYHLHGTPPVRALALDYPDDAAAAEICDQILIGDVLMAAPVMDFDTEERDIYLPKGGWYHFATGKRVEGGTWLKRFTAPLEEIPIFVKENALLPLAKPLQRINGGTVFDVDFLSFGKETTTELYADDFMSFDYEKGGFEKVTVRCKNNILSVEPAGAGRYGKYRIGGVRTVR